MELGNLYENQKAALVGSLTGVLHYISSLDNGDFWNKLISSSIIAFICGGLGILGRWFIIFLSKLFKKKVD